MTPTQIANLALNQIGEPSLVALDTDVGTAADSARLHYDLCLQMLLEDHNWNFGRKQATLFPYAFDGVFTATNGDTTALAITQISRTAAQAVYFATSGTDPNEIDWTFTYDIEAGTWEVETTGDETYSFTGTTPDSWPLGTFTGDDGEIVVTAPAAFAPWPFAYLLPTDNVRFTAIVREPVTTGLRFELIDGFLLTEIGMETHIQYVSGDTTAFPARFTEALYLLLASKLAKTLAQSEALSQSLLQQHLMALDMAKLKDTRETDSGENNGPRNLISRSHLVRARFRSHGGPGITEAN